MVADTDLVALIAAVSAAAIPVIIAAMKTFGGVRFKWVKEVVILLGKAFQAEKDATCAEKPNDPGV